MCEGQWQHIANVCAQQIEGYSEKSHATITGIAIIRHFPKSWEMIVWVPHHTGVRKLKYVELFLINGSNWKARKCSDTGICSIVAFVQITAGCRLMAYLPRWYHHRWIYHMIVQASYFTEIGHLWFPMTGHKSGNLLTVNRLLACQPQIIFLWHMMSNNS